MRSKLLRLYSDKFRGVETLIGKTLTEVTRKDDEEILFKTNEGESYLMYHEGDCCETVEIAEIIGELDDLVGVPILMAEQIVNEQEESEWGTQTWTFYKFATIKGYVTIRWLGESNGYYSESVDFALIETEESE